ncbi:hypothetical protein Cgig2_021787 [Carnegiea gigantea]|uniref:Uncharacterized protein n=1 Tax=Carnegiea gigantea TaxID=171969 RepID=A0A9Q1K9Q4_9CARY|nr:hypothetical protein Cgig2_021787 [Carnegiea gigantea]
MAWNEDHMAWKIFVVVRATTKPKIAHLRAKVSGPILVQQQASQSFEAPHQSTITLKAQNQSTPFEWLVVYIWDWPGCFTKGSTVTRLWKVKDIPSFTQELAANPENQNLKPLFCTLFPQQELGSCHTCEVKVLISYPPVTIEIDSKKMGMKVVCFLFFFMVFVRFCGHMCEEEREKKSSVSSISFLEMEDFAKFQPSVALLFFFFLCLHVGVLLPCTGFLGGLEDAC